MAKALSKGKVLTKPERCKGCGLCIADCPTKSISVAEDINKGGYRYTVINDDTCIACGICYTVCPDGVYEVLGE